MGVFVRFGNRKAFLRRGVWMSSHRELEGQLNQATGEWIRSTGGPPINDHDHERTVALEMAKRFGGKVVVRVKPSRGLSARIYISQRQLHLPFDTQQQ